VARDGVGTEALLQKHLQTQVVCGIAVALTVIRCFIRISSRQGQDRGVGGGGNRHLPAAMPAFTAPSEPAPTGAGV